VAIPSRRPNFLFFSSFFFEKYSQIDPGGLIFFFGLDLGAMAFGAEETRLGTMANGAEVLARRRT